MGREDAEDPVILGAEDASLDETLVEPDPCPLPESCHHVPRLLAFPLPDEDQRLVQQAVARGIGIPDHESTLAHTFIGRGHVHARHQRELHQQGSAQCHVHARPRRCELSGVVVGQEQQEILGEEHEPHARPERMPTDLAIVTARPEDFVIARNAEPGSTLRYLLRVPLGDGIILKAKDTWPRTGKVYCHRVEEWPVDAEIVERVAVRSCVRRGAAIDLVLDRGRENRSQIIVTNARGRQMIFWQTARTSKQARPAVTLPGARASGVADLEIAVDIRERYPFTFADRQATTRRERAQRR